MVWSDFSSQDRLSVGQIEPAALFIPRSGFGDWLQIYQCNIRPELPRTRYDDVFGTVAAFCDRYRSTSVRLNTPRLVSARIIADPQLQGIFPRNPMHLAGTSRCAARATKAASTPILSVYNVNAALIICALPRSCPVNSLAVGWAIASS